MDQETEVLLQSRIKEFKDGAWKAAVEEISSFLYLSEYKSFDYYSPFTTSIELLKSNEPLFRVSFFFRIFRPDGGGQDHHVIPSITMRKSNMEMSGLEKQFKELDKDISLIKASEITNMVKNLIRMNGGAV